jgi:putative intracellular protease/amidase
MSKGKVLVIGSNATRIEIQGGGWAAAGNDLNETVTPVVALVNAGYEVALATPDGTKPPIDAASESDAHFRAKAFWANDSAMNCVCTLRSRIDEGLGAYARVFVPGGQGPVVDLMQDPDVGEVLRYFHERGKPTALLCHGPIALVSAMSHAREFRGALIAGDLEKAKAWAKDWIYAGYRMTIFSASEEERVEEQILHGKLCFNTSCALAAAGGDIVNSQVDFEPNVIVDRELITGQNPHSDHSIAKTFVDALDSASA